MDWEARLHPVRGHQHYHLQWLLLHAGDNFCTQLHFSWKLYDVSKLYDGHYENIWDINVMKVMMTYQTVTHSADINHIKILMASCSVLIEYCCHQPRFLISRTLIWRDDLGGLSWSSAAVFLFPWCTGLLIFLVVPRMSTHSCIIPQPTAAAVGAVTHAHIVASGPAVSLMISASRHLTVWGTRTSLLWKSHNIPIRAVLHGSDSAINENDYVFVCWCYCSASHVLFSSLLWYCN